MTAVIVNGVELDYRIVGEGEPLVWVMGTGMSGEAWHRGQVPAFSERYRCLTYDLRGCGKSGCPQAEYTPRVLADDLRALLDATGIAQAHFVGFSLGSATVQELALLEPHRVRSAVLLSTWSTTAREHHIRRHYESRLYALEHTTFDVFAKFAFWMWSPTLVDEEHERILELEGFLRGVSGSRDPSGYAGHFKADIAHETFDRLGRLQCPTLVLHGEEDLITLPRYNETVARAIAGSRIVTIPRAGHLAFLEQPDKVNEAITTFLNELPGPRMA
jgi:pimeloyl-ACP methyl ester carboxylesterase